MSPEIRNKHDNMFLSNLEIVERIINLNKGLSEFWSNPEGWAPIEAAGLLSKSRLDWQLSLSYYLRNWVEKSYKDSDFGSLIMAWVNLGSLLEGTLKLLLSVFYTDYLHDADVIFKRRQIQDPDCLELEPLRCFFNSKIWNGTDNWNDWVQHIQQKRNAIHAFKNRNIGTFDEFYDDLKHYLEFLRYINNKLPYPDDIYMPIE